MLFRLLPISFSLLLFALLSAVTAQATPLTIAFDEQQGYYDPDHPGGGPHGPYDWIENGARYSGWWLTQVGTPGGSSVVGHTHLSGENDNAFPLVGDYQHSWRDDLQGTTISLESNELFDIVSIDIRIESRDTFAPFSYAMQRLPWSFALDDAQLLLSTNPLQSAASDFATFASQFSTVSIDDGSVFDNGDGTFDANRPADPNFQTITISGFENLSSFHLSHTAGMVWIDNIVLDVHEGVFAPVPEPGTALLFGLGLAGMSFSGRRRTRH